MRTNIDIDEALLAEAMVAMGKATKKGAVEEALRRVVQFKHQREAIEEMRGMGWYGDLDAMREGRDWTDPK